MAIKFSQFNLRTDSTSTMFLVGYDGNQNIHITVDNLINDFIDGTENTIAMFGPGGNKVIDSAITQQTIIAGDKLLTVQGFLNVDKDVTIDRDLEVTRNTTLNGNVILGNSNADLITQTGTLYLNGPVKDTTDTLGVEDQILVSDAAGELNFQDLLATHVESAEVVKVPVKNLEGSPLTKGDPVYISGSVGASGRLEVGLADASNAAKMPAVGLLLQDLDINEEGFVVITGKLRNLPTSPIDGETSSPNDVIYVKGSGVTGAALTLTKPVGTDLIQNMGKVGRASTSNDGTFVVSSILRTNDIPNLTPGKIWVGSTGNTIESSSITFTEATGAVQLDEYGTGTITGTPAYNLSVDASGNVIETTAVPTNIVETLTAAGGTYISLTDATDATGNVDLGTFDLNAEDGVKEAGERYLTKSNVWAEVAAIPGTYSFDISDGSTTDTISSGDTVQFRGNNGITAFVNPTPLGPDYVRIQHNDITLTPSTSTDAPAFGGTFEAIASITTNAQGHVTAVDTATVTIPGSGTMTGDISMDSNRITGMSDPINNQDAATKAYVDSLVEGGLTFKDGFNSDTGSIDGGGDLFGSTIPPRVAIAVGDFYVVTTAGDFYGDANYPLTVGDSVICKTAAAQGTSTVDDWVIVQGDEGVVNLTSGNGVASTGNAITSNTTARGAVTVQSFAYDGGINVGHVPSGGSATTFLRGDGGWVTPADTNTTYDLEGVGSTNGTAGVRLAGSDTTNDDILIVGAGTTGVVRADNTLTVTSNDQYTGTVTSVGTSAPLTGGTITSTGTIGITQATTTTDGYLSSTDWNTFNNKGSMSSFTISDGATTDTITNGNTIQFDGENGISVEINPTPLGPDYIRINLDNTGPGAGIYGSTADGTKIDTITLDAQGRVTAIATGATGDITGVTAGTNLNGGATSGNATLNLDSAIELTSVQYGSGVTLSESSDRADLLYINSSTSSYGGLQIGNTSSEFIFSLMGDGNLGGIYDDLNSDWIMQWDENGESRLYHNGGERLNTTSAGVTITGDLTVTGGDIVLQGTGRIQGIDTVSSGTDAANKTYVDNAIPTNNNQLTNGAGYITDGNTNWNNIYGFIGTSGFTMDSSAKITLPKSVGESFAGSEVLFMNHTANFGGSLNLRSEIQNGSFGSYIHFLFTHGGSTAGSIARSGNTSVSYNTSSDYRLKENVIDITDGIDRVKQLRPSKFNFIGEERIVDGFIAHEVQEVIPEAITGEKDEEDDDGNPIYQGIDQSKMVPLLTAALQEAIAKIESLEARVQALEGN